MSILVNTEWLANHLTDPKLVLIDVRWDASAPDGAEKSFEKAHLPGARFLNLDTDLSGPKNPSVGRHPLPTPEIFVEILRRVGIDRDSLIVAYDDKGSALAGRFWWMLQWIGGPSVIILDGGISKWVKEERSIESGPAKSIRQLPKALTPKLNTTYLATMKDVDQAIDHGSILIDARAPDRFNGDNETIDKRGGHIPGAINAFFQENLRDATAPVFKEPEDIRYRFEQLGIDKYSKVICYCGSGVTATGNVIAMMLAGFPQPKLYIGSWSEWLEHHS